MMRIALLAPEFLPSLGGIGTYCVALARELSRDPEIEVHVITPRRGSDYDAAAIRGQFENKIILHNISQANDDFFYNVSFQMNVFFTLWRLHRRHHFDLVHSANAVNMPDILLKFLPTIIPTLATVHTTVKSQSHVNGLKKLETNEKSRVEKLTHLSYPVLTLLERFYLFRTRNLICVSDWVQTFYPKKEMRLIHNGVDTSLFSPRGMGMGPFGYLRKDAPVVLFSGRLMALKGIDLFISAIPNVLREVTCHFVIVGPGDGLLDRLDRASKKHVTFLGSIPHEQMHHLYPQADIFVMPSYTESFPYSILEAMASGVAVISTKVGGIPEIITGKDLGVLIEAGDEIALSESIISLLKDNGRRHRLAEEGLARVYHEFSSKQMADSTKQYYEEICQRRS